MTYLLYTLVTAVHNGGLLRGKWGLRSAKRLMIGSGKGHDIKYTEATIEIEGKVGVPSMSNLTMGGFNLYV
jgi:hypothetical protein